MVGLHAAPGHHAVGHAVEEQGRRMGGRQRLRQLAARTDAGGPGGGLDRQRLEAAREGQGHAAGVVAATGDAGGVPARRVELAEAAGAHCLEQVVEEQLIVARRVVLGVLRVVGLPGFGGSQRVGGDHRIAAVEQGAYQLALVVAAEGRIAGVGEATDPHQRAMEQQGDRPACAGCATGRYLEHHLALAGAAGVDPGRLCAAADAGGGRGAARGGLGLQWQVGGRQQGGAEDQGGTDSRHGLLLLSMERRGVDARLAGISPKIGAIFPAIDGWRR